MNKWIAEFELEDGDTMPEHMDLEYKGSRIDFHCRPLEQEPCEDTISRKSIKQKLQEHHDFFVNAYGGFSNLPQNDKSRVDEITNCIAMVVNEPPVTSQEPIDYKAQYERFSKKAEIVISQLRADRDRLLEVLDKIRAEMLEEMISHSGIGEEVIQAYADGLKKGLDFIDEYKAEIEPQESESDVQ